MERSGAPSRQERQADYGQRWGEGAARCFGIEGNFLDEEGNIRLMPVPESFFCPISAAIMVDPVAAVDGCVYEREYIERWFRERRQVHQAITSPATGLELPSTTLMPLVALQRAIEAYLAHRPELRRDHLAGRSFEEAAQVLQSDLLEKQAVNATVHDELRHLREANKALRMQLRRAEATCSGLAEELSRLRSGARSSSEDERAAAEASSRGRGAGGGAAACSAARGRSEGALGAASEVKNRASLEASQAGAKPGAAPRRWLRAALLYSLVAAIGVLAGGRLHGDAGSSWRGGHGGRAGFAAELPEEVGHLLSSLHSIQTWLHSVGLIPDEPAAPSSPPPRQPRPEAAAVRLPARRAAEQDEVPSDSSDPEKAAEQDEVPSDPSDPDCKKSRKNSSRCKSQEGAPEKPDVDGGPLSVLQQIELLRVGDPDEKHRAVLSLLDQPTPSSADGGLEALVGPLAGLLDDDSQETQQVAAIALGALAAKSTAHQAAIVRAGAVPPLVRLLKGNHAQIMAANALRNLAANNDKNQVAIARAGAVAPLVRLLRDSGPNVQAEAAAALGNLAGETSPNHHEKQLAIARAGAVAPLVRLLGAEAALNRELAAGALRMLATNNADNQVAIAQAGAIRPLVLLLQDDAPTVRLEAAAALGNLAFYNTETNFGNQLAIAEAGAVAPLARLLQDSAPGVCEAAAGTLRNLVARNPEVQAVVVSSGALGPIMLLLQQGGLEAQLEAAGLLRNLAADEGDGQAEVADFVLRAGAVAPLLALLEVPELQEEAAAALWSLARNNKAIQAAVSQAGAMLLEPAPHSEP